jgi:kynurenine formamidase
VIDLSGRRVFDLAQPYVVGMPQSANHPKYQIALARRHGDVVRADGGSAASELLVLSGHLGTHVDALCHVSQDGRLHGGVDAAQAQLGGYGFSQLGIETVEPFLCRGVLLDIPALHGVDVLEAGQPVVADDLEAACERQHVEVREGDAVLVRTGWARHWDDPVLFAGAVHGAPGPDARAARWLAARRPRVTGTDTVAYEAIPPGKGHALLPVHSILLVEHGIHIVELLALEELAAAGCHEFLFVAVPLKLVGATGSPVRPLAIA